MKLSMLVCGAVAAAMVPVAAMADDPHDPAMRNAAARAADSARTRALNRQENARVLRRGVRWHMVRADGNADAVAASRGHERAMARYGRDRARYEREMAEWRRAAAACRAGDYAACDD
jgi:hypothetical protein